MKYRMVMVVDAGDGPVFAPRATVGSQVEVNSLNASPAWIVRGHLQDVLVEPMLRERRPLTDGMLEPAGPDDHLTLCVCWSVQFDHYSYQPSVVVPVGTDLSMVEALARRALLEYLGHDGRIPSRAEEVAKLHLVTITRIGMVHMHPGLG